MTDRSALEALATSFEDRAERLRARLSYTRSGALTRWALSELGMGEAYMSAARELRALLAQPSGGTDD